MNVWNFILQKMEASVEVMLLYVLHSEGSSPGRQGFKMAVAADNSLYGSIGGGIMEHKFVEMAKATLQEARSTASVYLQVHDKATARNQSGMICSGEQTIFLYHVQASDLSAIKDLTVSLQQNRNGSLQLSPVGIRFSDHIPSVNFHFEQESEKDFLLVEKTGYKNTLHIIGGGHCALALSRLMHTMDFYIHLYEERADLNTMEQNNFVHEKHLLHSYADLNPMIAPGENVYVVIMTMGYRTDDKALRALMNKEFRYIGVLGSKTKMEKMYADYRMENIGNNFLLKIKTPIGIPIKSQTPEEIAVSIAAGIIAEKNKDQ
jgi:xanthine dehydrogenase accessory factor